MNYPAISAGFGLAFLMFATAAQAETLVEYLFTANNTTTSRDASTQAVNVTADPFANGAGSPISSSSLGSPDVRSYYVHGNLVDQSISPTSNDWLGFTINANPGYELNLESLSFAYAFSYNSGTAPVSAATFDVRSNVNGYSDSIDVFTTNVAGQSVTVWKSATVVLNDPAFQNLSSITFRIFLNDGTNNNNASYLRIDTVNLAGTVATPVPEPSSYALLAGSAGLMIACLRRRRGRSGSVAR